MSGGLTSAQVHGSRRWTELSRAKRAAQPWCSVCGAHRDEGALLEVDHVVPLIAGGDPWADANLEVVCAPCHRIKAAGGARVPSITVADQGGGEGPRRSPSPGPPPFQNPADLATFRGGEA